MTDTLETLPGPPVALTHRRVLVVISALVLGMFLAALDQTVVSTALPTIVGDLHGASHLTWVVTAYLLASTVSTPLWGKLGDQYGRKFFFQAAIVIFLIGSALSGLSHSMLELIVFRALQGLGGGGLMVGAQTIVGDVVSPRDRGRYMGLFMAMFGVTTVIGPLIGGVIIHYLSWRWIFYINIPIGAVALVVTVVALPGHLSKVHRVIDYLGTALLARRPPAGALHEPGGGVVPLDLALDGRLGVAGVGLTILFVLAERRAKEPVIPLQLFSNRVFSAAGAIGFVVGFAMFGALTFLPLFLQDVKGLSPIESGLRVFPMMGGLLVASIGSGQLVSRWGRYKVFPVVGTALMTMGLYLMSLVGVDTGAFAMSAAHGRLRLRSGPRHAGPGGGGPERRALRGTRDRHLGYDVLPDDRRIVRYRGVRCRLRQHRGGQRLAGPASVRPAQGFSLNADNPDAINSLPPTSRPGCQRASPTPSRRSFASAFPSPSWPFC